MKKTCLSLCLLPVSVSINWSSLFIQIRACFQIQAVQIIIQWWRCHVKKAAGFFFWIDENTEQGKERAVKRDRCNSIMNESLAEALISGIGGVLIPLSAWKTMWQLSRQSLRWWKEAQVGTRRRWGATIWSRRDTVLRERWEAEIQTSFLFFFF